MPVDAPDWTLWTQRIEVVGPTPTPEQATTETPISKTEGKVTEAAQTYTTLATWTVTAAKNGILFGVELYSSNFPKSRYRLTIGGVQKWTDIELPTALNIYLAESRLAAATVVLLEGKSSDGTSVDLWGHIEGKEVG